MVRATRLHEEPVAQAVHVGEQERVDRAAGGVGDEQAFGAAAHRAGEVQSRGGFGPAGQDEVPQRRELGLGGVDLRFQPGDPALRRAAEGMPPSRCRRRREVGADREQFGLHRPQPAPLFPRPRQPLPGRRTRSIRRPCRSTRWPRRAWARGAADQAGRAVVAGAGVDLHGLAREGRLYEPSVILSLSSRNAVDARAVRGHRIRR